MVSLLILPLWAAAVVLGLLLVGFRRVRWLGIHLIVVSTSTVVCSFAGSVAGLMGGGLAGHAMGAGLFSILLAVGGWGLGMVVGAIIGAIGGFAATAFFQLRARDRNDRLGAGLEMADAPLDDQPPATA